MITYSTNWMGPISMDWFRERGLTKTVREVLEEDQKFGNLKKGEVWEYEDVTTYYSAGRIDIYGVPDEPYPLEYGLAPMHGEDWNDFSDWLDSFQTHELWNLAAIIALYESASGKKIRWADDTWYRCWECGWVTDLRKHAEHIHKMDCTRKWGKE